MQCQFESSYHAGWACANTCSVTLSQIIMQGELVPTHAVPLRVKLSCRVGLCQHMQCHFESNYDVGWACANTCSATLSKIIRQGGIVPTLAVKLGVSYQVGCACANTCSETGSQLPGRVGLCQCHLLAVHKFTELIIVSENSLVTCHQQ